MLSEAELILDRRRMKRRLIIWRTAAVVLALVALVALVWTPTNLRTFENHVARLKIEGLITGDQPTLDLLAEIAKSDKVKGVIVRIDSPGGTTAGSEAVYEALRLVASEKPVVAVMDTVAASGGYITAIAADHIVARGNSITGSIGVIFSFPEVSRLLDNIGVKVEEIKSGNLKAEPSPYKPVSGEARAVSQEMVQDGLNWFVGLVADRRGLPEARVRELADGRVYTGRQALEVKLIDRLGGEDAAIDWLETERQVQKGLKIVDWTPRNPVDPIGLGFTAADGLLRYLGLEPLRAAAQRARLDGMLVLWHPSH